MQFFSTLFFLAFAIISPILLISATVDIPDDGIRTYPRYDTDEKCQPAFFEMNSLTEDYHPDPHPTKPLYHAGWCRMHMVHARRHASPENTEDYQQFTLDLLDALGDALIANKTVHWWGTKHLDTTCKFPNPVPRGEVAGDPNKTFEFVYNKNLDELHFSYGDQHWKVEDEGNGKRVQQGKPPRKDTIKWQEGGRLVKRERCSVQKWQGVGKLRLVHRYINCWFQC